MADRFGTISLQGGLIKNRHRAYTLEGVRARVGPTAQSSDLSRTTPPVGKLGRRRASSGSGISLIVEGPGFSWRVSVRASRAKDAAEFAQQLNDAARAYALHRFGGHLTDDPSLDERGGASLPGLPALESSNLDKRPELIEHAFSAADHMSRSAARKARLVR